MRYKKLKNLKCDSNGTPLLLQYYSTHYGFAGVYIDITFFNGLTNRILAESFHDVYNEDLAGVDAEKATEKLEQLCIDFGIVSEACEQYAWLEQFENGKYLDSSNPVDITYLQRLEALRLKEEELKGKIDKDIKRFMSDVEYRIESDSKQEYIIVLPHRNKIIATGKTLEDLHSSLLKYINLKSLSPSEYLTKIAGEMVEKEYKGEVAESGLTRWS